MNDNVSLKKASTFYLIGSLFNKGIGFITVPIFTRILTLSDYGIVTTYNSWVSIISMFISLALYMGNPFFGQEDIMCGCYYCRDGGFL